MKHILAILACAVALMPQPANAQANTEGLMDFTKQRLQPPPAAVPTLKQIPLPPVEFDHPYAGQLNVTKWNDYSLIRFICKYTPTSIACSYRTYNTATGAPISCLIMLGPKAHDDERALRHEMGHCNGWSGKHEGARQ